MLLGRPWLKVVKVAHDWGNDIVTIQSNGIVRIITVAKHLGSEIRKPEMLLCCNYQNGITNEEENIIFATKPKLFSIGTISLPETIQSMKTTHVGIMDIDVKTNISKHGSKVQSIEKKIPSNRYEPEVALEDKVHPEMYYIH
jgi:hypothetical protein